MVDLVHGDCDKGWQSVENPAALTARERDDVQDGETACPAQVGQISMKLTSSLGYAKRGQG